MIQVLGAEAAQEMYDRIKLAQTKGGKGRALLVLCKPLKPWMGWLGESQYLDSKHRERERWARCKRLGECHHGRGRRAGSARGVCGRLLMCGGFFRRPCKDKIISFRLVFVLYLSPMGAVPLVGVYLLNPSYTSFDLSYFA